MRTFITALLLSISTGSLLACDMCACSSAGTFSNLSTFATYNFLMLRPSFSSMHSDGVMSASAASAGLDLAAGFGVSKRWHITAYIPLRMNTFEHEDHLFRQSGIGDLGIMGNYVLYSNVDSMMVRNKFTLSSRIGVELPTGKFNAGFREEDVPAALSTGSGSYDAMGGARLVFRQLSHGLAGDYMIKYNTVNPESYQFGVMQTLSGLYSYRIKMPAAVWLPNAGISGEWSTGDQYHELLQPGTKGYAVYGVIGGECALNKWVLGIQADIPAFAKYDTAVKLKPRGALRLVYLLPD